MKLATQQELLKVFDLIGTWEVQNDKQDKDTNFIYYCNRVSQVIDLAITNDVNISYALHRWFNYMCSKKVESIFCDNGALPCEDIKNHDIDLYLSGIPFDIKVSVISNKYSGDTNLQNRDNKDSYMQWLKDNASKEGRKQDCNRIYVICDKQEDKCNFDMIASKVKMFCDYFYNHRNYYTKKEICELIYVK